MFILAKSGESYARLRVNTPLGPISLELPVAVDYAVPFAAGDPVGWKAQHTALVTTKTYVYATPPVGAYPPYDPASRTYAGMPGVTPPATEGKWYDRREFRKHHRNGARASTGANINGTKITAPIIMYITEKAEGGFYTNAELSALISAKLLPEKYRNAGLVDDNLTSSLTEMLEEAKRGAEGGVLIPAGGSTTDIDELAARVAADQASQAVADEGRRWQAAGEGIY